MSRGQADFGMYAVKEVTASISDMGEVAARLGSIVTYDKRGDVVFFDNFEEPVLKWDKGYDDANHNARLSSDNAKSGSQAVRIYVSTSYTLNWLMRPQALLGSKRLGFEISFCKLKDNCEFEIRVSFYGLVTAWYGAMKLDPEAKLLYIATPTGTDLEIGTTGPVHYDTNSFHTIKLVVDFAEGKYMRLMYDTLSFDLSAHPLVLLEAPVTPYFYTVLRLRQKDGLPGEWGEVWLDDFVLTQAEP